MKFRSAPSTVVVIPSEYPQHDLVWSFQSIFIGMRFYGIDLDELLQRSALRRYFFTVLGISVVVYSCGTKASYVYNDPKTWKTEKHTDSYIAFDKISWCISAILCQVTVYWAATFKWRSLWKKAKEMEHLIQFPTDFYRQLRKVNLTCISVGFIWVNLIVIVSCNFN